MPGKSCERCAAMTSSRGTKRSSPTGRNRAKFGGTLTRAKCSVPVRGLRTTTARFSDSPEMYGNGCAGSTASGVSTGKIRSPNSTRIRVCSASSRSSHREISMPSLPRAGSTSWWKPFACRVMSSRVRASVPSCTSRGSSPLAAGTATPAAIRRLRPATLTMKNSSRLLEKIARNLALSSRGRSGSSASSSTRVLKASQDSSRSRYRSSVTVGSAAMTFMLARPGELRIDESATSRVHDVHGGAGEAERRVEPDRGVVVRLDVQHHGVQPHIAQVVQTDQGERSTESGALLGGVDAENVDLPDHVVVDLGPVEADHARSPSGDKEARRVEPWLGQPLLQVGQGPPALLRVVGEGTRVEPDPFLVVEAGNEGVDDDTGRETRLWGHLCQRARHLPERAGPAEPGRRRQAGGRSQVSVRPDPKRRSGRRLEQGRDECTARAEAAPIGGDDQLRTGGLRGGLRGPHQDPPPLG